MTNNESTPLPLPVLVCPSGELLRVWYEALESAEKCEMGVGVIDYRFLVRV